MIDHLLGRPSGRWKRSQVFLVLGFWTAVLLHGNPHGPRFLWIRRVNRFLHKYLTPWQLLVAAMTGLYAVRHFDSIVGLASPEPLAKMYSRAYYRATWIVTSLDAGFATAMPIRPKWVRDIAQVILGGYYIFYANEADEKLRRFRAVCTVEMLRTTWEKTANPYLRLFTFWDRPSLPLITPVLLPRPPTSPHKKPIKAVLFFSGTPAQLKGCRELILDFPGGGFICMGPQHHEERLRRWARRTGRPVLSVDYGKAPEYPYPWALEEGFDAYLTLVQTKGSTLGMAGDELHVILTGDSAGANLVSTIIYRALSSPFPVPSPLAVVFNYPALDFSFSAWMSPAHLRVLRTAQSEGHIPGVEEQKNHLAHRSPLSVVRDTRERRHGRTKSWREALAFRSGSGGGGSPLSKSMGTKPLPRAVRRAVMGTADGEGHLADTEEEGEGDDALLPEEERPIQARIKSAEQEEEEEAPAAAQPSPAEPQQQKRKKAKVPIGTRLTMTSRTGYFQDRIISPSMMRAMAILYIGSRHNPDFETDFYISPILAPNSLLERFPPLLMTCGEKDPFVDDTIIFAGRIREAKRARRVALQTANLRGGGGFGDGLRMSGSRGGSKEIETDDDEEDWVQTHIFEGWSHAYMMMTALIPGAVAAINQNADWMVAQFERHAHPPSSSSPRPAANRASSGSYGEKEAGEADGGFPLAPSAGASGSESEEVLEFASSKKKRRQSSISSSRTTVPTLTRHGSSIIIISADGQPQPPTPPEHPHPPARRSGSHSSADRPTLAQAISKRVSDLSRGAGTLSPPHPHPHPHGEMKRAGTPSVVPTEAELMRRRREEAVWGIGEGGEASEGDGEGEGEEGELEQL